MERMLCFLSLILLIQVIFGHLSSIDDAWDELNADELDDGHYHDQYGFGTIFGITPEYAQHMMFRLVENLCNYSTIPLIILLLYIPLRRAHDHDNNAKLDGLELITALHHHNEKHGHNDTSTHHLETHDSGE